MRINDLLKKIIIVFFKILGITNRPHAYFTVNILDWNTDCTPSKAAEIEKFLFEIKGYENRIGSLVDWYSKQIFIDLHSPDDPDIKELLTLKEVRFVEKLILDLLEKKGYKTEISEERLSGLYGDWFF